MKTCTLTIAIKGEYFDQIKAGTKPEEYRCTTAYWRSRLENREYDRIVLTRGYPEGGGIEGKTRLTRKWIGCTIKTITHPHFGVEPVEVFAIDVSVTDVRLIYDPRFPTDGELVRRAIKTCGCPSSRGRHIRWQAVMDTFMLGSTYAWQLCERFGVDPEERVRL